MISGNHRGTKLGFPTANLCIDSQIALPGDGIYATWAFLGGVRYASATSIGVRPTFGLSERLVEVHVMDFDHNIYGESIGVEFVSKLRDQESFPSSIELIHQINQDVKDSRRALAQNSGAEVA